MSTIVFLLCFAAWAQAISNKEATEEWNKFQTKFQRQYKSTNELTKRHAIFLENLKKIEAHNALYNASKKGYIQGITQFTDWTTEEFSQYVNRFEMKPNRTGRVHVTRSNFSVPETVDWRINRAVSEVKNQGHCGSCWSFSATGSMEGQAQLVLGKHVSLSEQNLIDCATEMYANHGCNGGNMNSAFLYVEAKGIEKEQDYPYVARQGKCRQTYAELYVSDYRFVEPTEEALKEAVAKVGPISVGIEATSELQNYVGGVIFDKTCTNKLNHGVLVVGYGVENGQDYWLIKNSWGSSWGEQGYFKLARNKYNNCGVADTASYPLVKNA